MQIPTHPAMLPCQLYICLLSDGYPCYTRCTQEMLPATLVYWGTFYTWTVLASCTIKPWLYCRRTHQSLASVGVAALVRLVTSAGTQMSSSMWQETVDMVAQAVADTVPQVAELVSPPPRYHPNDLWLFHDHCASWAVRIGFSKIRRALPVLCAHGRSSLFNTACLWVRCVVTLYLGRKV